MNKYLIPSNYVRKLRSLYRRRTARSAYLVAGLGRCGTTMLYETLIRGCGLAAADRFIVDLDGFSGYENGFVYKTHDYPPGSMPENVKVVYMFRNPMNIAISAHNKINQWGRIHHKHFHSDRFRTNDDILKQDTLMLEKQFDAWYREQGFDFISIRYENMFESESMEKLRDFLGLSLKFEEIRPSTTDFRKHAFREELARAYGPLAEKIEKADPCRIWKARSPE